MEAVRCSETWVTVYWTTCCQITQHRNLGEKIANGKAMFATGHGDRYGSETSRLPHFLNNRLTDGGEVVSLKSYRATDRFVTSNNNNAGRVGLAVNF
jgi:hypothetical protein